jgi:hypothetical protein
MYNVERSGGETMPRIILDDGKDKYAIWCKVVPPPVGGSLGNLLIPNVECKKSKFIKYEDLLKLLESVELSSTFNMSDYKELCEEIDGEYCFPFPLLKKIAKEKNQEYFIEKYFSDNQFIKKGYDYISFKRLKDGEHVKLDDIVIELKKKVSVQNGICLPYNGGDPDTEITINIKTFSSGSIPIPISGTGPGAGSIPNPITGSGTTYANEPDTPEQQ